MNIDPVFSINWQKIHPMLNIKLKYFLMNLIFLFKKTSKSIHATISIFEWLKFVCFFEIKQEISQNTNISNWCWFSHRIYLAISWMSTYCVMCKNSLANVLQIDSFWLLTVLVKLCASHLRITQTNSECILQSPSLHSSNAFLQRCRYHICMQKYMSNICFPNDKCINSLRFHFLSFLRILFAFFLIAM